MKLKRYSGWTQRNHQYLKTGIMSRGQAAGSREKVTLGWKTEQRQVALASLAESAQCQGIVARKSGKEYAT